MVLYALMIQQEVSLIRFFLLSIPIYPHQRSSTLNSLKVTS